MQTFLHEVAEKIYATYNNKLDKIAIVFPNRRPILFFKSYLSDIAKQPIWSPEFFTIQELFIKLSGFQLKDNISLLFDLYEHYIKFKGTDETFDDFLQWGEMLLNDFDDIDKFQVNAADIFQNLSKQKSIEKQFLYLSENQIKAIREFWENFDPEPDSDEKKDFISVWEILTKVYTSFTSQLKDSKQAYEGLILRDVAEKIKTAGGIDTPHEKYIFVGFNALNSCEKALFSWLQNINKGVFFWDYDLHYTQNKTHQAGRFIRESLNDYKLTEQIGSEHISKQNKQIFVYNSGTEISQSLLMKDILLSLYKDQQIKSTNTAIVLSDESLLEPVLQEIPKEAGDINITMGYPITLTSTYSFIKIILNLQNIYLLRPSSGFYYKSVLELLAHPFTRLIDEESTVELQKHIESKNRFYIQPEELVSFDNLAFLFKTDIVTNKNLSDYLLLSLKTITNRLQNDENINTNQLELEFIFQVTKHITRLDSVLSENKRDVNIKSYVKLFLHLLKNLSIPFSGEPLKGLQIMGILESRSLDFENLIILSLNEGILPKRNAAHSYIPANLRYAFGLPLMDHQDSFFSYYFYRLIQRAKNIHLIYFSKSNGFQKGEKSRFIYQLEFDKAFNVVNKNVDLPVSVKEILPIEIKKDEKVFDVLGNYRATGNKALSPSAINTYIDCSLKFYFKYIAKIKEPDKVKEEVEPVIFGNILHNTIDELYNQFNKKTIAESDLESIITNKQLISSTIKKVYNEEFLKSTKDKPELTGQDEIMLTVFEKYVNQIFLTDKIFAPFEIVSLENEYTKKLTLNVNGKSFDVAVGGKIDRIDKTDGTIRILDYKTGNADTNFTSIESLFDGENKRRNKAAFQTLLYCFLFENSNDHKHKEPLRPGIYQIKKLFDDKFDYSLSYGEDRKKIKVEDYRDLKETFLENLKSKIEEIFNPGQSFCQATNTDICKTCPYAQICERVVNL